MGVAMDTDKYPLDVVIDAVDAGLDGVVLCSAAEPFQVRYLSQRAAQVLRSLDVNWALDVLAAEGEAAAVAISDVTPVGFDVDLFAVCQEVSAGSYRIEDTVHIRGVEGTIRAYLYFVVRRVGPYLVWAFREVAAEGESPGRPRNPAALDPLTGTANRAAIRRSLEICLERLEVLGEGFALEFLDVDDLGGINAAHGRGIGDVVLREIGSRMRGLIRGSDTVGRVGGDEFVLVWPGVRSVADVQMLHRRVCDAVALPLDVDGRPVAMSITAGAVFVGSFVGGDPDDLLRDADAAMREAKALPDQDLVVVEPGRQGARMGAFVTAGELRQALRDDEFVLYAQPMVDVRSGLTAGAEMLVRWYHPERGLLNPADFMTAAEVGDIMDGLGSWVIDRAVAQASAWDASHHLGPFRVSINVWPRQLTHSDVVRQLGEAIDRHGARPENFLVEIIESQDLESRTRAAEQIRGLLDMGVRVGIDDFGSGFANMSYLRDLPVDIIKVDRALVSRYPTRREEAILEAVQSIAAAIGADVVLEGVEQIAQLEAARRCGVKYVQGFLVGRPTLAGARPPHGRFPLPPMTTAP